VDLKTADRPIRIGLLWHSASSGNLGVGALTMANMAIVRTVAAELGLTPRFLIIGMRDGEISYVREDEAGVFVVDSRSLISPRGCWSVIGQQDCILDIGGGDSFADIYGLKRFLFLWLTKMMAIAGRTPLMLSPQTIGPFSREPYRSLARIALTGAESVAARDQVSLDFLRALAPRARAFLSVDVAFALPFEDRGAQRGGERIRVGVNVSGLLYNEAQSGRNRFGLDLDYARLTHRFLETLAQRSEVETHLITHANSSGDSWDDDGRVADRLAESFPKAIRVPNFPGPSEAKSYISSLDFLVAGRMHACIAAMSTGTPVVPVAYSRKFSGLFGMLGYDWILPVKGVQEDQALAFLGDCLDRRSELARDEAEGMSKVEGLLEAYRAELRRLLSRVAAR
jgi:colanic acid/amylovoran biosynthesis protein